MKALNQAAALAALFVRGLGTTAEPTAPTAIPTSPTAIPTAPTDVPTSPSEAPTAPTLMPTAPTASSLAPTFGAQTELTEAITAGSRTLHVADISGFSIGDMIAVDGGGNSETRYIVAVQDRGRRLAIGVLTVNQPFIHSYPLGSTVGVVQGSVIGSDPITIYNGKKTKFWLPNGERMKLLQTPDMVVYGVTFGGPGNLQWFGRFMVTLPDGRKVVDISVHRNTNATRQRLPGFKDVQIMVGENPTPLRVDRTSGLRVAGTDVHLGFSTLTRSALAATRHTASVVVEAPSIAFTVFANHAGTEFPHDMQNAFKYKHLDIAVMEMRGEAAFTGILPELWGIAPLSEDVEALLQPPSSGRFDMPQVCKACHASTY